MSIGISDFELIFEFLNVLSSDFRIGFNSFFGRESSWLFGLETEGVRFRILDLGLGLVIESLVCFLI